MTKAELVELVLLRVSGGKLSTDVVVRREDISFMLPAAYSLVLADTGKEDAMMKLREFRIIGPTVQSLSTYTSSILTPVQGDPYYYMTPTGANDTGNWVARVAPKNGEEFIKARSASDAQSIGFPVPIFWTEGKRIYIFNQLLNCDLRVTYNIDPTSLEDDDDVPFPDGGEAKVIEYLCAHFEKQRGNPTDYKENDHDVKQVNN